MWITAILICNSVVIVITLALCLCGRRKTQKNDWLGLDGMVTQKNPDENVNHLPSANTQCVPDGTCSAAGDANDRRPAVINNPRRSLPDIPSEGHKDGDTVAYEPSGDNFSELYATVEPYQNGGKRQLVVNNIPSRPSISQHSSISQADETLSPYARVKEHPYDKLRKTEHPYASVKSASQEQEEDSSSEATPRTSLLRNENPGTSQTAAEPIAPPRSRRSSSHNGTNSDIPAATAVAGGIPANQELPYMTPPIAQTNFSGDSQDSSKGYTSITVREPLANIRAQTKEQAKIQTERDPHYSTVSDDSDEMYTTIQDPNNPLYTSGSETYAQIQPVQVTIAVEVNAVPPTATSSINVPDGTNDSAPQPPSVDSLKHVTQSHSRQASNSSSVGNLSSPKPEKRQANSPLPAPPPASPLPINKSLDDMYAKVHKNKKKPDGNGESNGGSEASPPRPAPRESRRSTASINSAGAVCSSLEGARRSSVRSSRSEGYAPEEHDYETLKKSHQKCFDPGYEQLRPRDCSEPGYDTINNPPPSLVESDPGYEVVMHGYEELSRSANDVSLTKSSTSNGYSVVNKSKKRSPGGGGYESDANYESMPSESFSEHNYAMLKSGGSDTDPNYESVSHSDPNYESVKYLDVSMGEPPYERLHDDDSSRADGETPGYERVGNGPSDDDMLPGYETLPEKKTNGADVKRARPQSDDEDDEAIVQV